MTRDRRRVRGTEPIVVDGIRFASKREARRWSELRLLERAGQIADLERQVPIVLQGRDGPILTRTGRHMKYVADFRYVDRRNGAVVIEDAKGWATDAFALKRAILAAMGVEVRTV